MASWLDALLSILFAPTCASCGQPLDHPTAGAVCHECWSAVLPLTPPLCDCCGDPLASWRLSSLTLARCPRCRRRRPSISSARAIGPYDGTLRTIIHALKYDGRRSVARPLAHLMMMRGREILSGGDFVVPVPLHPSRLRERGFNQADDLARHLHLPRIRALRRVRATATQVSLPAARRHRNVRDAFAPSRKLAALQGKVVVLIDDVSTTGATLDACADVLMRNGVREVRALTAARVVQRRR